MVGPLEIALLTGLAIGLLFGPLLTLGAMRLWKLGKARIVWVEGDGRVVDISFVRIKDGRFKGPKRDYLVDGNAKHGGSYSTWLLDPTTGWNLRAPTRKETFEKDLKTAVLEPSNPESYHRALHRHRWNDILRAGDDANKYAWVFPVAIVGLLALVGILFMVGYIMTKMTPPGA